MVLFNFLKIFLNLFLQQNFKLLEVERMPFTSLLPCIASFRMHTNQLCEVLVKYIRPALFLEILI